MEGAREWDEWEPRKGGPGRDSVEEDCGPYEYELGSGRE